MIHLSKDKLPHICFFGCGNIAARHAKILKKIHSDIDISFASRNLSKSKEYVSKYGGRISFGSYEDAAVSDLFDIAFITTPPDSHSKLAILNADNNKDIIIEKPITRNIEELNDIERAVAKNRVNCTVAENYYYKPFIKRVREYIEGDYIGNPLIIDLNKTNRDKISGWRSDASIVGGGALLEGGVHWINALVSLAGASPVQVLASKPDIEYDTNIPFEDSMIINVEFENGMIGRLLHSWRIPNSLKGVGLSKVYGTEGVITFESNGLFVYVYGKRKGLSIINPMDFLGFKAMHKAFIEAYISQRSWQPSLERIRRELRLIDSAYKSLYSKKYESIL
ncbi:MAG: Gfo/Idh/MocA family oxidoreductase [Spirochaetota bacterium]|nr:Gfo/Idh/MocA family oxidoreductase [Spirochaetota bacterium]